MKMKIRDILFWIFLAIALGLIIWNLFGNSPTEFIALVTLIFAILLKVWSISDRQLKLDAKFNALARDFKEHVKHK